MLRTPVDLLAARAFGIPEPALTRKLIRQRQAELLRRRVAEAKESSPFFRKRFSGINPDIIWEVGDITRLPFMDAEDIRNHAETMLCLSQSEIARVVSVTTSGSTGSPKRLFYTESDLLGTMDFFREGMTTMVGPGERVLVLFPEGSPAGVGDLLKKALCDNDTECRCLWPPDDRQALRELLFLWRPHCVVGLPSHILRISHCIPPGCVQTALLCSEYAPPVLRRTIERSLGCRTFLHYGSTESGLGGGVECQRHSGCHIRENDLLVEVVDPKSGIPLPDGKSGEIVLTHLTRRGMPLIRYRTGDRGTLHRGPCLCGGVTARLSGLRGRIEGPRLQDGTVLLASDIDDAIFRVAEVEDYRAILTAGEPDALNIEYAGTESVSCERTISNALQASAVGKILNSGNLRIGGIYHSDTLPASPTLKRMIIDRRMPEPTGRRHE